MKKAASAVGDGRRGSSRRDKRKENEWSIERVLMFQIEVRIEIFKLNQI